jgi:hypothetical protein
MPNTLPDPRLPAKGRSVAAKLRLDTKDDCDSVAADWKRRQAAVFVRVLQLGRMEQQELAYALGYSDKSTVSKWAAATERPQWDRIAGVAQLAPFIAFAWAEAIGSDIQLVITVRRGAA